jgi:hypothetical protein
MANILSNQFKSSNKHYQYNLALAHTDCCYLLLLMCGIYFISNNYLFSIILAVLLFSKMFAYIFYTYYKAATSIVKLLYGYKPFGFESFTPC